MQTLPSWREASMLLVLKCVLTAVRQLLRPRGDLVLENLALRHQLEVLTRNARRPTLQPEDRLLWPWLSRLWPEWRQHIVVVRPDTVVRWHRLEWRRYWAWRSCSCPRLDGDPRGMEGRFARRWCAGTAWNGVVTGRGGAALALASTEIREAWREGSLDRLDAPSVPRGVLGLPPLLRDIEQRAGADQDRG